MQPRHPGAPPLPSAPTNAAAAPAAAFATYAPCPALPTPTPLLNRNRTGYLVGAMQAAVKAELLNMMKEDHPKAFSKKVRSEGYSHFLPLWHANCTPRQLTLHM